MPTVVVIERDRSLREVVARRLRREGCAVYTARNGDTALRILDALCVARCLVIVDTEMADLTEDELAVVRARKHLVVAVPIKGGGGLPALAGMERGLGFGPD